MPATLEPRSGNQPYVDCDEYIDIQLSRTQSQIKSTELLLSASALGLAVLAYMLAFVVLDQWIIPGGFSVLARSIWLALLVAGGGSWLTVRILIPWFKTVHELYAAKMIESADPTLKSSVLNLVDMQMNGMTSRSPMVLQAMEKRAAVQLSKVDVDHAVDRKALMRLSYTLLAMLSACCLYVLFSPKDAFSSVQRLLLPATETSVATQTTLANITPEDARLVAGEFLTVEVDVHGQVPPEVKLLYSTADQKYVDQPVDMQRLEDGAPRFRGVVSGEKGRGLMQSIVYRIEAGDARTRDFNIDVVEPPSSQVEKVNYVYPAYTRLEPKTQTGGTIEGWEGTKVAISAVTSIPVASAILVMTDTDDPKGRGEEIRMSIRDGKALSADWTLNFRKDGTFARYYHIECTTEVGESDPRPTVYTIKVQPDQRPDVSLLHPTQDLERPVNSTVPMLIKASDPDFLLRFVTLRVEKGGEEIHAPTLLDSESPTFEGTYDLNLESLGKAGLKPGDEILYWVEARDNKQPHGNRTTTQRMKIKITDPVKPDEAQNQLQQDRKLQKEELARQNPDNNRDARPDQQQQEEPKEQPQQPGDQPMQQDPDAKQEPRNPKPGQPERQGQPGDPQKPQANPEKPEADQQPMPGDPAQAQPNPPQPGQGEPQPGAGQPGQKKAGQKQTATQNKNQDGTQKPEPETTDGDSKDSANPSDARSKSARKQGPADFQTAIQKFLEKQQDTEKPKSEPMDKNADDQPAKSTEPMTPEESEKPEPGQSGKTGSQQQKSKPQDGKNSTSTQQPGTKNQSPKDQPDMGADGQTPKEQGKNGQKQTDRNPTEKAQSGGQKTGKPQPGENAPEPMTEQNTENPEPTAQQKQPKSQPETNDDSQTGAKKTDGNNTGNKRPMPESGTENDAQSHPAESKAAQEKPGTKTKPGTNPKTEQKSGSEQKAGNERKVGAEQKQGTDQKSPQRNPGEKPSPAAQRPNQQKDPAGNSDGLPQETPKASTTGRNPDQAPMNKAMPDDAGANGETDPKAENKQGKRVPGTGKPMPDAGNDPMQDPKSEPGKPDGKREGKAEDKTDDNADQTPDEKGMPPQPNGGKSENKNAQSGKPSAKKVEKDAQEGAGPKSASNGQKLEQDESPMNAEPGSARQSRPDMNNTSPKKKAETGNQSASNEEGNSMPSEEDPNAEKRKADGSEKGTATGQEKPEDDAPTASPDVKKAPGSKSGFKKPSNQKDAPTDPSKPTATKTRPDGSRNQEEPQPGTGEKSDHPKEQRPGSAPSENEPAPGKGRANQKSQKSNSGENGGGTPQDQGTEGSNQEGRGDDQPRPGEQSAAKTGQQGKPGQKKADGSQKRPGDSKSGAQGAPDKSDQQAESPSTDRDTTEQSKSPKDAASEDKESSEAETGENQPGKNNPGKNNPGKPGEKSGTAQKNGDKKQSQPGKSGSERAASQESNQEGSEGGSDSPESSGKPGAGGGGKPSSAKPGAPGQQPGRGKPGQSSNGGNPGNGPQNQPDAGNEPENQGNGPGNANGNQPNQLPPDEQAQAAQEAEEKANEEYARKASSLVLKKLKKELDRGEVDRKLLEELGWTKDDMQRFVKRLEKQLQDAGEDTSPESAASRKQFEETLKAAMLSAKTKKKTAKAGITTRVDEAGARRIPVPLEYQELYEEYNKDLAKPAEPKTKK